MFWQHKVSILQSLQGTTTRYIIYSDMIFPGTPTVKSTDKKDDDDDDGGGSNTGLIVGVVLGIIALFILIGIVVWCVKKKKKNSHSFRSIENVPMKEL